MTATFTATAEPSHVPPRVRLDLDTGSVGTVFETLTIYRDGVAIRTQPPVGSSVTVAFDYEAPFGSTATYTVAGTTNATTNLVTEAWGSLSGWATASGSPSVAMGHLLGGAVTKTPGGSLPASGRIVLDALAAVTGDGAYLQVGPLQLNVNNAGTIYSLVHNGGGSAILPSGTPTFPLTASWSGGVVTFADSAGRSAHFGGTPTSGSLPLAASAGDVGGFTIDEFATGVPLSTLTDTAELDVDQAWLIHPAFLDLSLPIDNGSQRENGLYVTSDSAESVTRVRQGDVFAPVGRSRQVVVTNGNRREGDWSLVICAPRIVDRDALVAELRDQTPLLLRVPPSFGWDLPDDYYSVGDVSESRIFDQPHDIWRVLTLPLTPVDPPVVTQAAQWTYADTLQLFATYSDAAIGFPTYLDRFVGVST